MRWLRVASLLALSACAWAEKWTLFKQGSLAVYSSGRDRDAQDALNTLLQLQHTLSEKFGKELNSIWPLAVVQQKANATLGQPRLARETYLVSAPAGPLPRQTVQAIADLLLKENTSAMDPAIERGIARLFSTLECDGPRVTLGAPPPPADRDLEWARVHLLLVDSRYSGKARVLLSNFAKGIDGDAAWKNTIGVLQRDFDQEAKSHLANGQFGTIGLNGKPLDPRRLRGEELEEQDARLLEADLTGTADSYKALLNKFPDLLAAREGLALATNTPFEGANGPRALALLNTKDALEKAWRLNPRWSQPHEQLAKLEEKNSDKAQRYRKAAELAPRETRLWQAAAEAFEAAELHAEATKMWYAAERSAGSQSERDALREVRIASTRKRADAEDAERRRVEEERQKELERLKNETLQRIREAEAKANAGAPPLPSDRKVVEWWDGPKPDGRVQGTLTRVDCLGQGRMRIAVRVDSKTVRQFTVKDPSQIVVQGGSPELGCGLQKPARAVVVEHFKSGEVATLTFAPAQ